MPDTKRGREKQARDAELGQRERDIREERARRDEADPTDPSRECRRRGCTESPSFVVLERYQEETGQGAVEAEAFLCRAHTAEESPANLDAAYPDYVFRVEPLPGVETTDSP
jgi:hypothetical protein